MSSTSALQTLIAQAATSNGVPTAIALAQAQQESSLNPNAYNPKSGATGLFQLIPSTSSMLGVTNPLDPAQNAQGGTSYLAQLYSQFGDWAAALAAFDWGPTNVSKAMAANGSNWLAAAPAETQNYVANILGAAGVPSVEPADSTYAAPADYTDAGVATPTATNPLLLIAGAVGVYFLARFILQEIEG